MNSLNSSSFNNSDPYQELTRSDIDISRIFTYIGSSLSLIGTTFIMISYMFLCYQTRCLKNRSYSVNQKSTKEEQEKQKYQKLKMGFGNDLIFCLSVSEFLISVFSFINPPAINSDIIDKLCIAQGFLLNFFEISSLCWISAISFSILLGTMIKDPNNLSNSYIYLFIYSNLLPIILSFGPLITSSYGPAGTWCWMNIRDYRDTKASIWAMIIYIVHFVHIVFNVVAIVLSIKHFKVRAFEIKEERKEESNFLRDYCIVLKFFPMILILCIIPGTINRAFGFFTRKENLVLYCLQSFFDSIQGFLDSIIYSYYYRNLFKTWCGNEENKEIIIKETSSKSEILSETSIIANKL